MSSSYLRAPAAATESAAAAAATSESAGEPAPDARTNDGEWVGVLGNARQPEENDVALHNAVADHSERLVAAIKAHVHGPHLAVSQDINDRLCERTSDGHGWHEQHVCGW